MVAGQRPLTAAEETWPGVDGQELVALVRAQVWLVDGKWVEREAQSEVPEASYEVKTKPARRKAAA